MTAVSLWPFQKESKDALRANLRKGIRRQVLCSPTGSGKTRIAISITQDAQLKGNRVLFVCDRQTLVMQTSDRFSDAGVEHGLAMGEATHGRHQKIQIASAQTLERRGFLFASAPAKKAGPDLFEEHPEIPPDLVFVDECHTVRRKLMTALLAANVPLIGLSATPFTKGLGEIYQDVVNVTTTNELIHNGIPCTSSHNWQPSRNQHRRANCGRWRRVAQG